MNDNKNNTNNKNNDNTILITTKHYSTNPNAKTLEQSILDIMIKDLKTDLTQFSRQISPLVQR